MRYWAATHIDYALKASTAIKFFIDTADIDAIRAFNDFALADALTMIRSIIMKSSHDIKDVTKEFCDTRNEPVFAATIALDTKRDWLL